MVNINSGSLLPLDAWILFEAHFFEEKRKYQM
jgi:hypothetical protein